MQGGMYSPDGRWWWDGQAWRAVEPRPPTGPPGLFWFFGTPGWAGPFFLTGLILMLPIVGQMVALGWYLTVRDNLRRGWRALPPASFDYLERGLRPWVVGLLYGLYGLPVLILLAAGLVVAIVAQKPAAIAVLAVLLAVCSLAYYLALGFLAAALYDLSDARGIGSAAHPGRLWAAARADSRNSWRVFGAFFLGGLILFGISVIALPLFFVPFGSLLLYFVQPGIYLMAAPAQADFNGEPPPAAAP
jgi:hypothetical protein